MLFPVSRYDADERELRAMRDFLEHEFASIAVLGGSTWRGEHRGIDEFFPRWPSEHSGAARKPLQRPEFSRPSGGPAEVTCSVADGRRGPQDSGGTIPHPGA